MESQRTAQRTLLGALVAALALVSHLAIIQPLTADAQGPPGVRINEFVADNLFGLVDNTGAAEDWIELRNTTAADIDLGGWTIEDSGTAFTFDPGTIVPADGFVVLFASDDVSRTAATEIHLPFKLSASGDALVLTDPTGAVSTPSWPADYPAQSTDLSYGPDPSGALVYFTSPTPGAPNTAGAPGIIEPVTMSTSHGWYDAPITVVLDTPTPAATIRYTTDGSTPSPTNGAAMAPGQSLTISSTTVLRAVAHWPGWVTSEPTTATYLFAADVITQSEATPPGFPDNSATATTYDYGMDPADVTGNEAAVTAALLAIPSVSLVTDPDNLFDPATGLWENPFGRGMDFERATSVELIDPTGAQPGFTATAGLRIRGGASRKPVNPKHSLRLHFREQYGGNLDYTFFDDENGASSYEAISLATAQHGSFHYSSTSQATWVREVFSRDTQRDMGHPHTRSDYLHLFINGQYWGLYFTQERVTNQFGADYLGGNEDDYDVVTNDTSWLSAAKARDGTIDAWDSLWPLVSDLSVDDAEFATLAANVDLVNLADYYLIHYMTGNLDGSPAYWGINGDRWVGSNNWRATRDRAGGKWRFFHHDTEISLCWTSTYTDVDATTPWNLATSPVTTNGNLRPSWLHEALLSHPAYRQLFTDRVATHMVAPDGALTVAAMQARWDARVAEVDLVIDAEAARWGDKLSEPGYDRATWQTAVDAVDQCFIDRFPIVQSQIEADGLWPSGPPPVIDPPGPTLPHGTNVTIDAVSNPGTIWYTTDGTDPRLPDGTLNPSAISYSSPITLTGLVSVNARVLDGTTWSPISTETWRPVPADGPRPLVLNEWNAVGGSSLLPDGDATLGSIVGNGGEWFELVVTEDHLDLRGWRLEITDDGQLDQILTFTNDPLFSGLRAGTLITIAAAPIIDEQGVTWGEDPSYRPAVGDWWIHLVGGSAGTGTYVNAADFSVSRRDWQLTVFDDTGVPRFGPAGEGRGTLAGGGIGRTEVGELEADPTSAIDWTSNYGDGDDSTFGLPNVFAGADQDLDAIRPQLPWPGDANCSSTTDIVDALMIAQYTVGLRSDAGACPLVSPPGELHAAGGDINDDGRTDILDALLISQCTVQLVNPWCPPSQGLP